MAVEDAIFTRLSGFAALTALVPAARIVPDKFDGTNPTLPYISWGLVGTVDNFHTFSFPTDWERTEQYRFHVWAETGATSGHDAARDIAKQIRNALQGYKDATICSYIDDEFIVSEESDLIHHRIVDVLVTSAADDA